MTTRPVPRILTVGFASLGLLALAGCAVESAVADTVDTTSSETATETATTDDGYTDGTYSADATYQSPSGTHTISVELTIADDTVTAVEVSGDATEGEAGTHQQRFIAAISDEVVGQDISTLSVSRVAGASLTSDGFTAALDEIRSQAS
jgi:uncharacterized protein with FMN-binding domain